MDDGYRKEVGKKGTEQMLIGMKARPPCFYKHRTSNIVYTIQEERWYYIPISFIVSVHIKGKKRKAEEKGRQSKIV